MNNIDKILIFFFTVLFINPAVSQEEEESDELINWYNTHELGIQTHKAYKKLKRKKSKTVIVAVIDSGVDIEHEDLKGQIWINEKRS